MSRPCWSPIVELRRYSLHAGQRDVLIELFDRELVETQEAVGMKVIGQFRDLDDPDQFVWLRGFPNMESRARSLAAFYGGPVWKAHREAANATMIDSDNVLLLRPEREGSAFTLDGERGSRGGLVLAAVAPLEAARSSFSESNGSMLGSFVTEESENTFPNLPVREGERVFVWFAGFADRETLDRAAERHADPGAEVLRLEPTSRSLLGA